MPITIHCPHDKAELQLKKDNKGPEGLLECPKCGCTFRVCLAIFDKTCFVKVHPTTEWKSDKKKIILDETGHTKNTKKEVEWFGGPMQEVPEEPKRKRGRPKKNELKQFEPLHSDAPSLEGKENGN